MAKTVRVALVLLALVSVAGTVYWLREVRPSTPVSAATNRQAEKVEGILQELETNHESGKVPAKTYVMTQPELNAYVKAKLQEQDRKGVEDFSIQLKQGTFVTLMIVNMDEVELKGDSMTLNLFKALLSGNQTLEVEGRLVTENGMGNYTVERARLNNMPVPASLVNMILSSVGKRQDPPFDPTEPFEMPYSIKNVTITTGQVAIRT